MRYYLIAGEASGDLHGANLIQALKAKDEQAQFRFFGGERMKASAGEAGKLVRHYKDGAVMGLGDVLAKAGTLLRKIKDCKKDISSWQPDVVILIDYPGFNMKIARYCHEQGIRVYYYIAPKTWASREGRNRALKKYIDALYIIFPFEVPYFQSRGLQFHYLGNPLLDAVDTHPAMLEDESAFRLRTGVTGPYIALLAGSRKGEISRTLPVCCTLIRSLASDPVLGKYKFVIAAAPSVDCELYNSLIPSDIKDKIIVLPSETYAIIRHASAAIVNSGTASLETALIGTPQVVCWSTGAFTAFVGRKILRVLDHIKYISLGNLCIDREAFRELIQEEFNPRSLETELRRLLCDEEYRERMMNDYSDIRKSLGGGGASTRIAESIIQSL